MEEEVEVVVEVEVEGRVVVDGCVTMDGSSLETRVQRIATALRVFGCAASRKSRSRLASNSARSAARPRATSSSAEKSMSRARFVDGTRSVSAYPAAAEAASAAATRAPPRRRRAPG